MNSTIPAEAYRSGLIENTTRVFETLLHRPVSVLDAPGTAPGTPLTAAIHYAGAWQGAFVLECSAEQAREWSGGFLETASLSEAEARDGLGELTNVLAGNMKPLLPPGVGISLPSVVEGSDYSVRLCGGNWNQHIDFADRLGTFRITLVLGPEAALRLQPC